jgi:hypothetical protein
LTWRTDLDENVAVKDHEVGGHLTGDLDAIVLELLVHAEEHVVSVAIVASVLLFPRYDDGRASSLWEFFQGHVQTEQVLGILKTK